MAPYDVRTRLVCVLRYLVVLNVQLAPSLCALRTTNYVPLLSLSDDSIRPFLGPGTNIESNRAAPLKTCDARGSGTPGRASC